MATDSSKATGRQSDPAGEQPPKTGGKKKTVSAEARAARAKKRRRAKRIRLIKKIITIGVIAALVMGIAGTALWILFDKKPETSVQNYPVIYEEMIRTYASENNIPPAYVASVILAESSYRPEAVSYANAQGLMQILPTTGEWIAGKFDETYTEGCLFDPETNIKYGCWYLGFLMSRYDGDMKCSSSAYHAGQGTVDKWLKDPANSADGKTLDNIPSEATETYVSRILKYYEKYEKIYA